ncbi:invasion associated locus B family protein [Spiribacter insolitus]|uniref:Invasion associated locus B family protein n=1 Tax=Spiribacter insolitus TaxID=3122417 RepID=A0ABV3T750_9GAMM
MTAVTRSLAPIVALLAFALVFASGTATAQSNNSEPALQPQGEQPQAEVRARHENWIVRCQPAPEEAFGASEFCEMYQQVSEQESEQTVLEVVIGYPQDAGQPVALFNLPLGMRLPPGVQMQVDDNEPIQFPVQLCLGSGCRADIELGETLIGQMRAGTEAVLTIVDPQGRNVEIPMSLLGFSAALAELQASQP